MRKSSKKVLEAAYQLVERWAENYKDSSDVGLPHFLETLKQYDEHEFFAHYALGIERALAQLRKEKGK